jgi:hypothetical protein
MNFDTRVPGPPSSSLSRLECGLPGKAVATEKQLKILDVPDNGDPTNLGENSCPRRK